MKKPDPYAKMTKKELYLLAKENHSLITQQKGEIASLKIKLDKETTKHKKFPDIKRILKK